MSIYILCSQPSLPPHPPPSSGVPWELKARDYAAETITAALGSYAAGVGPTGAEQGALETPGPAARSSRRLGARAGTGRADLGSAAGSIQAGSRGEMGGLGRSSSNSSSSSSSGSVSCSGVGAGGVDTCSGGGREGLRERHHRGSWDAGDVIAVSAMEGIGIGGG